MYMLHVYVRTETNLSIYSISQNDKLAINMTEYVYPYFSVSR